MIIGYIISGNDNNSHMFDSDDKSLQVCKKCGYLTDLSYISPTYKLVTKKYDISSTYDNRTIVSMKFKQFCIDNNYDEVNFQNLPNNPDFFELTISKILRFDEAKANLRYYKLCEECSNYESFTPALPVMLKDIYAPLDDGFYATDIIFASGNEKCPLKIVGVETYKKMKEQRFKGINFIKIEL